MSVNPEDWDVDFAFSNFYLALFLWQRSWCRNCNLTEEENSSQCLKILTQITIDDELADIRVVFPTKNNEQILRQWQQNNLVPSVLSYPSLRSERERRVGERTWERGWQQTYLEKLLSILQCFFYKDQRRKDGNDFETDTVSGFQNTPELKIAKSYRALSFDLINFFSMANLICCHFLETLCYVLLFSWANKNFLFWRLSKDCQLARPALVSGGYSIEIWLIPELHL